MLAVLPGERDSVLLGLGTLAGGLGRVVPEEQIVVPPWEMLADVLPGSARFFLASVP